MAEGFFTRTATSLVPADDASREVLTGIKIGTVVQVRISRPRNINHHRKYWALCSAIASSIGAKSENVSDVLKLRTGHFTVVQTKKERHRLPRSISFAQMDQDDFSKFFDECVRVVCEEFLPHMTPSGLRNEIEQMVGVGAITHAEA